MLPTLKGRAEMKPNERLGSVVTQMLAVRGHTSPEKLAQSYLPDAPPVSARTMRRIMDGTYAELGNDIGEMTLLRLGSMLKLPPATLRLVLAGDVDGIARLEFKGEEDIRQFVIDTMAPPATRSQRRAAN